MTPEHLVATLLARGASIRVDETTGELVIRPASVVTPELLDALRSRKPEIIEVVRRMQARERARGGPLRWSFLCAFCGSRFLEDDLGPGGWLPTPDGAWWPRCPACTDAARTPAPVTPPSPRRRGAR